jgi:hypothetical protein
MYGFGGNNLWAIVILILIVLQWFRVGGYGVGVPGVGGPGPGAELGLMANGGLFIIALFILIACSCFKGVMPVAPARYGCGC